PLMVPPQLTPTVLPYTTLFRSLFSRGPTPRAVRRAELRPAGHLDAAVVGQRAAWLERAAGRDGEQVGRLAGDRWETRDRFVIQADRKSTRLNSSHGSISYAVFC